MGRFLWIYSSLRNCSSDKSSSSPSRAEKKKEKEMSTFYNTQHLYLSGRGGEHHHLVQNFILNSHSIEPFSGTV